MATPFNPADYASSPKLSTANAVPLVRRLLLHTPKGAPDSVRMPAREMRVHAESLRTARLTRRKREKPVDRRVVDQFADASLGRLYRRIEDYSNLPVERHPLAPRAAQMLALLFPEGLDFLSKKMDVQWNATDELLRTLDDDGLQPDLDRVAGVEFLAEVRLAHDEYGKVLGITKAAAKADDAPNLLDLLQRLSSSMNEYVFQLAALAASRTTPEPLRIAARAALAPVDAFRAALARKASTTDATDDTDEGDKPLPDAPTD